MPKIQNRVHSIDPRNVFHCLQLNATSTVETQNLLSLFVRHSLKCIHYPKVKSLKSHLVFEPNFAWKSQESMQKYTCEKLFEAKKIMPQTKKYDI